MSSSADHTAGLTRGILALNGGSSSLKLAVFDAGDGLRQVATGSVSAIGAGPGQLKVAVGGPSAAREVRAKDHEAALDLLLGELPDHVRQTLTAVAHRIVHGGPDYTDTMRITPDLLEAIRRLEPFDPEHLPAQVRLIEATTRLLPDAAQLACFDTAFHRDLPAVARRLPIPRRFDALGVRRYGFHGISYAYLLEELWRLEPARAAGRIILAHLGNGASLAAVRDGRCIDTSMAFTPAAGIPMGSRSGDLDPGLAEYLLRTAGLTPAQFNRIVHLESGLKGISETTANMQQLLAAEERDPRAAEAVEIFCYHVRKWIGAYAAALGGLDVLVFAGGIGEHAAEVRRRVCRELGFLGIALDPARNERNDAVISVDEAAVQVRVIATHEELMMARDVARVLGQGG